MSCFELLTLGGGFKHSLYLPLAEKMIQFDEHIFQITYK